MRRTSYGMWTMAEEPTETEKAFDYVVNTAKEIGMEVVEGETAIDFIFIADLIKRLKGQQA